MAARMRMWEVGEEIEIGKANPATLITEWVPAIVTKLIPLSVQYEDGSQETLPFHAFRRRPDKPLDEVKPKKLSELPPEALKDLYHKALVEIIREGETNRPNATVRRIVNIAKACLGETPI